MKKIIVFYSYTGKTKLLAERMARDEQADLLEVGKSIRPPKLKAFFAETVAARKGKITKVEPITDKLSAYDEIIIMGPIWAGFPAPAVNGIIDALPPEKTIRMILVSAKGHSNCKEFVESRIVKKCASWNNFSICKIEGKEIMICTLWIKWITVQ